MFGALEQVVSSAAVTRAQTVSRATPSTTEESLDNLRARHNGPADQIGQARLSLSFGLADAVQSVSGRNSNLEASNPTTDVVHTLASKVLHTPLFTAMEWSSSDFQPAKVFHLAGRILEGKTLSSLTVAQATTDIPTMEDPEEAAKRRARLVEEAIASFNAHTLNGQEPTSSYHSPASAGAAYLSDVAARPARERRGIRPGVVRMVNDSGILMVNRAGGNPIRVAPQYVMMDSGAQPVIIGKKLAQELQLTADDLAPCPFTIVTSIGHVERATGYTREPLQLSFRVKLGDSPAPLLLRCAVTDATNYDILVGQQVLYPLGFGLDNWTEEAWIRPGWSAGDGRKELIPVAFAAAATIEPLSMVFGCSAIMDPHYWRSHWHSWGMLKTHETWHLDVPWCSILRTLYLRGMIPPACSKDVRTLSSLLVLPHLSFWMVHPRWHAPFCGAFQTLGLLWWSCLGASPRD
jgi:hypothetical protein